VDPLSIEAMYRAYGPMVLRRARVLLGDEHAAGDAMHDIFLKAWRAGDSFRGDASPTTWLYRITTNHCLNILRDRKRRGALLGEQAAALEKEPGRGDEDRVAAAEILSRVPEALREIAVYYYVDQMNQDEIAALLGVSRRTVGYRLEEFRAAALAASEPAAAESAS
jgi:RNA polymerase sigma-70 factor (ECF subfamily)